MSEHKHAPGPWKLGGRDGETRGILDANDDIVGEMRLAWPLPKATANARLIASAPELLAALKRLLFEELENDITPACEAARAAIAKAEGGES